MTTNDTRAWLAALLAHLNRHPHLDDGTISQISGYRPEIQVPGIGAWHRGHLRALADWARTLADVEPVRITCASDDDHPRTHLEVAGRMVDGSQLTVVTVIPADESDLLAANLPLVAGTEFDVDTLYRLTDAEQGRPVHMQTGPTTVRCGAPMSDTMRGVTVRPEKVTCPACLPSEVTV